MKICAECVDTYSARKVLGRGKAAGRNKQISGCDLSAYRREVLLKTSDFPIVSGRDLWRCHFRDSKTHPKSISGRRSSDVRRANLFERIKFSFRKETFSL